MSGEKFKPVIMPKWGLAMHEGKLVEWCVEPGGTIQEGDDLCEIETDKITNVMEAPYSGTLVRAIADLDEQVVCGALIGVIAEAGTNAPDEEVDAFVTAYLEANPVGGDDDADDAMDYEIANCDGISIAYTKSGEGDDHVVLIHGFGGDRNNWMMTQEALSDVATVWAIDLPGHGASDKAVPAAGAPGDLAKTALAFLDANGIDAAHLVAHSYGGAVALCMLEAARERVLSVSLIAPAALGGSVNADYIESFQKAARRKDLMPVLQTLVADTDLISREMVSDLLAYKREDGVTEALAAIGAAAFDGAKQRLDLRDALSILPVDKVLIVWGSEDRIVPMAETPELPEGFVVRIIEGAGHMPQLEKPGETNELLREIILGLSR